MTKLPFIALTALFAVAGLAAPSIAATPTSAAGQVPYCATGNSTNYDAQISALSTELQLSTKQGSSVGVWAGCIKVTTIEDGKSTTAFYDPDSLRLVAEL